MKGVEWDCDLLLKMTREDENFLQNLEKTILEKLSFIRPIYEKGEAIPLAKLKRYFKEYEEGFPWFYAMWVFTESGLESKFVELNLENIYKLRISTDKMCGGSDTIIRKSLEKLFPNLGDLSSVIRVQELLKNKIPSKTILEKRYKGYFLSNDQLFLTSKSQVAKKLNIQFIEEKVENKNVKQLKGSVACQGIAKGHVRILMGHGQIHMLKIGEILVSPMTIPDFLPAMTKAAAFVTDEGGILCHAAIVAREFNKPCITGTKFATQIFKDGDFVEVDANKGIIKLIK